LSESRPIVSCVVITYNMRRELARTLHTLSADYQRDVDARTYEVIVVDNGGSDTPSGNYVKSFGENFSLVTVASPSKSPASALNVGARVARGRYIVSMIDGARMLSPRCMFWTLRALESQSDAVVTVPSWHLGPDIQNVSVKNGYCQDAEDRLLATIDWRRDGYALFDVSARLDLSSEGASWFQPLAESNFVGVSAKTYWTVGGFEEAFTSVGGGAVNLDFFRRVCELPGKTIVSLLGEGTFHQFHGGVSTGGPMETHPWPAIHEEYISIRGFDFQRPRYNPVLIGQLAPQARAFLARGPAAGVGIGTCQQQ